MTHNSGNVTQLLTDTKKPREEVFLVDRNLFSKYLFKEPFQFTGRVLGLSVSVFP